MYITHGGEGRHLEISVRCGVYLIDYLQKFVLTFADLLSVILNFSTSSSRFSVIEF